jgi:hypothetical protein
MGEVVELDTLKSVTVVPMLLATRTLEELASTATATGDENALSPTLTLKVDLVPSGLNFDSTESVLPMYQAFPEASMAME